MKDFIFHEEYLIDIPEERKMDFLAYIVEYGLYGKIPDLKGFELSFWKTIQRRIEADKAAYKETCLKRKINAIKSRQNRNCATENDLKSLEESEKELNELIGLTQVNRKITDNSKLIKVNRNISINTNNSKLNEVNQNITDNSKLIGLTSLNSWREFESEFESEFEYEFDSDIEGTKAPDKTTPPMHKFSKTIFNLFKDAQLPCSKGNEISFLQTDFKNAINYIHESKELKGLHSSDIIGAVKNYIQVYNAPDSYITAKLNFFALVKSKMFYNLLPANFDLENYRKFDAPKNSGAIPEEKPIEKVFRNCPKCGQNKLWFNSKNKNYFCDGCFETVEENEL